MPSSDKEEVASKSSLRRRGEPVKSSDAQVRRHPATESSPHPTSVPLPKKPKPADV